MRTDVPTEANRGMKKTEILCRARIKKREKVLVKRIIAKTLPNHCQDERPCPSVFRHEENSYTIKKTLVTSSLDIVFLALRAVLLHSRLFPSFGYSYTILGGGAGETFPFLLSFFTLRSILIRRFSCFDLLMKSRGKVRKLKSVSLCIRLDRLLDDEST